MSTKDLMEEMQTEAGLTEISSPRADSNDPGHFTKVAAKAYAVQSAAQIAEPHVKKIKSMATMLTKRTKSVAGSGGYAMDTASELVMQAAHLLTQAELILDEVKSGHVGAAHRMGQKTLRRMEPLR
jgi:hypothetical protein